MRSLIAALGLLALAACDGANSVSFTGLGPLLPPTASPAPPVPAPPPPSNSGPVRTNPIPVPADAEVMVTVEAEDPRCFVNWDSTGRCQQFEVTMPADGRLIAVLTMPVPDRGFWNPDVFLVDSNGDWVEHDHGRPRITVRMAARAGEKYVVLVLSYGPFPDVLQLRVATER
jgi:hypothetical protein